MFRNSSYETSETKKKVSTVILIIIVIGFFAYLLISGITDITDKNSVLKADIDMAGYGLEVEHSINGLIPTGKEHYYIGINSEEGTMYLIRAGKKWLEDNFDTETHMAHGLSVEVKAKVINTDYKVSREISGTLSDVSSSGIKFVTGTSTCYDAIYMSVAIRKIIGAAMLAVVSVMIYILMKNNGMISKAFSIVLLVTIMAGLIFLINLFTYI